MDVVVGRPSWPAQGHERRASGSMARCTAKTRRKDRSGHAHVDGWQGDAGSWRGYDRRDEFSVGLARASERAGRRLCALICYTGSHRAITSHSSRFWPEMLSVTNIAVCLPRSTIPCFPHWWGAHVPDIRRSIYVPFKVRAHVCDASVQALIPLSSLY